MTLENSNPNEPTNETLVQSTNSNEASSKTNVRPGVVDNSTIETIVVEKPFDADAINSPERKDSSVIRPCDTSSYSQIAEVCLYYEKNWTPERVFSIRDALEYLPPELRREAFKELVCIDISLGAMNSAIIQIPTYKAEFPCWTKEIDEAYKAAMLDSSVRRQSRIGRKLGNLRLEGIIGKGGMGVVYKAYNEDLRRYEAVKYLAPTRISNEQCLDFIRLEIVTNGQVNDPRFARAFNSGNDGNFYYLVMEYVDGVDLGKYLRNERGDRPQAGPLSFEEAAQYVCEVAKGLASIHRLGIIHRDIKPENIVLDSERRVRILDLGLAKWRENESQILSSFKTDGDRKNIVGTPAYMSPEGFYNPELVDEQSDLYSLGGVFFFLVTGKFPIHRYNPQTDDRPRPIEEFLPTQETNIRDDRSSSKKLLRVLEKLLEPSRDKRYKTAQEVVDDIERILSETRDQEKKAQTRAIQKLRVLCAVAVVAAIVATALLLTGKLRRDIEVATGRADQTPPSAAPEPTESAPESATEPATEPIPEPVDGAPAVATTSENIFQVEPYESGVEIVGLKEGVDQFEDDTLVVPGSVDGKPVLRVQNGAFAGRTFRKVVVSEGVREIGADAFAHCPELTTVVVSEGTTKLCVSAFLECPKLISVALPKSLTIMEGGIFLRCPSLASIQIPENVSQFDRLMFTDCKSLKKIDVDERSAHFKSVDGVLLSKDGETLFAYPPGKEDETYVVPDGVKQIFMNAFEGCEQLTSIKLPEGLKRIGASAFARCKSLPEINLPESVGDIFELTFDGCESLESIFLPRDVAINDGSLFNQCASLKRIEVDERNKLYRSIDGVLFSKDGKTLVAFPPGKADEYVAPEGVVAIGANAFIGRRWLKAIILPESLTQIENGAFFGCEALKSATVPKNVKRIGFAAFRGCFALESTSLPDGLEEIGFEAFADCHSLKTISLPKGLETFAPHAFISCRSLQEFNVDENSENFRSIDGVLFSKDGKTLVAYPAGKKGDRYVAPDGVTRIADAAFLGCDFLKEISLPASVKTIEDNAFPPETKIVRREE